MVSKEKIELLRQKIDEADAIVVGGASGMSAASGFVFYYQEDDVFRRMAGGLAEKYDRHNMFDLFYDRRPSRGEQWALMLRVIHYIYECYTGETYTDLAELLKGKDYYIATTNQDAQFYRVFPAGRITRIQGDWRYWQCSRPCHDEIYDNKEKVYRLMTDAHPAPKGADTASSALLSKYAHVAKPESISGAAKKSKPSIPSKEAARSIRTKFRYFRSVSFTSSRSTYSFTSCGVCLYRSFSETNV